MSPAPIFILVGIVLGQAFFAWSNRRVLASACSRSELPHQLETRAVSGGVDFVTNNELRGVLAVTPATPEQVEKAVALNEDARLRALRASFLIVGAISLLAISRPQDCRDTRRARRRPRTS